MSNPVGWSSTTPPQYIMNRDPNVSEVARRALMSPQQSLGAMMMRKTGGLLNADLPEAEAKAQTAVDYGMAVAGATNPIRAFHGSPHTFNRFDMSKLGTGEGAQAYGHGLYFAGDEGVARAYRDALSEKELLRQLHMTVMNGERGSAEVQKAMAKIDEIVTRTKDAPPLGSMYEVNLRTSPERLLDWDKPLAGQAVGVRDALRSLPWGEPYANNGVLTGGQIAPKTIEGTSQLHRAGIDGIRYLDAGSRGAGNGSSNYVMFDDKLIDILRRYGILGTAGGGAAGLLSQEPAQ